MAKDREWGGEKTNSSTLHIIIAKVMRGKELGLWSQDWTMMGGACKS